MKIFLKSFTEELYFVCFESWYNNDTEFGRYHFFAPVHILPMVFSTRVSEFWFDFLIVLLAKRLKHFFRLHEGSCCSLQTFGRFSITYHNQINQFISAVSSCIIGREAEQSAWFSVLHSALFKRKALTITRFFFLFSAHRRRRIPRVQIVVHFRFVVAFLK